MNPWQTKKKLPQTLNDWKCIKAHVFFQYISRNVHFVNIQVTLYLPAPSRSYTFEHLLKKKNNFKVTYIQQSDFFFFLVKQKLVAHNMEQIYCTGMHIK